MENGESLVGREFFISEFAHMRCSTWYLILHGEKVIDSEGIKVNVIFPLSLLNGLALVCMCVAKLQGG